MKFAFEEFHLWYQFALSLMAAGKVMPPAGFICALCLVIISALRAGSGCNAAF